MSIEYFSDRMEFQSRGAAHVHGVAWCNMRKVSEALKENETYIDNLHNVNYEECSIDHSTPVGKSSLESAFSKMRSNEDLNQEEQQALTAFADKFITCTLNPNLIAAMIDPHLSREDGLEIQEKVKEVQTHFHTKTCRKKSKECRFGIPRFPIWKTMLSEPIKGDSVEEKQKKMINHKNVLKAVMNVLENAEDMKKIWSMYDKNSESVADYIMNRKR